MTKNTPVPAVIRFLAILALLAVAAGCGEELSPLGPRIAALENMVKAADETAKTDIPDDAIRRYVGARAAAEQLLADLVPGDAALEKVVALRNRAVQGQAEVRARILAKTAKATAPEPVPEMRGEKTGNLLPPVVAYVPPVAGEQPKQPDQAPPPDGTGQPAAPDGSATGPAAGTPTPPATGETPGTPPAATGEPQPVQVTKVVLKPDGRTVLIYWKFTNLGAGVVAMGAPMGHLLNVSGGELTSFRQHFLAKDFAFNEADPLSSRGTLVTPESVRVGNGESREMVTIGVTTQGRQAGGGKVVVRMADGSEPSGSLLSVTKE